MSDGRIDYGLGQSNICPNTGIRFSVISIYKLHEWAWDEFEMEFGEPHCPECDNEIKSSEDYEGTEDNSGKDYYCEICRKSFWSDVCFPDEPIGHTLDRDGYKASVDTNDNTVILEQSPYFTFAQFCSPCFPGGGHLEHPCKKGVGAKCFCFGPKWFDGDKPPYNVWSVETGKLICRKEQSGPNSQSD